MQCLPTALSRSSGRLHCSPETGQAVAGTPASTQPAPGLHGAAEAGPSPRAGHPTLSSCSAWQLNMPLISKTVKHVKVNMSTGSTGKQ